MRTLSVREPYISRIMRGEKTVEIRTWSIATGTLQLHASATVDRAAMRPGEAIGPLGCLRGLCRVAECRDATPGDSAAATMEIGPDDDFYAIVLADVVPVEPVPVRGRLGLFHAPESPIAIPIAPATR